MVESNRCRTLWQSVKRNLECCAETSASALRFNSAMVKIDETFGNGEPEAEAAELSAYRRVSLFKGLRHRSQPLRLNPDPGVGNFKMTTCSFVIKRAYRDLSTLCGELHGVVNQVPKHLLKPNAIRKDMVSFRVERGRHLQLFRCDG